MWVDLYSYFIFDPPVHKSLVEGQHSLFPLIVLALFHVPLIGLLLSAHRKLSHHHHMSKDAFHMRCSLAWFSITFYSSHLNEESNQNLPTFTLSLPALWEILNKLCEHLFLCELQLLLHEKGTVTVVNKSHEGSAHQLELRWFFMTFVDHCAVTKIPISEQRTVVVERV